MKIKIVGAGWAGYTGHFGTIEFKDGVSVEDVSPIEAQRLGAVVQIETLEGVNPSVAQRIIDSRSEFMEIATTPRTPEVVPEKKPMPYSAKELEEIADKGGIKALREIADQYGVKGRGISELIRELGALRQPEEAQTAPAVEPQPEVQACPIAAE